MRSNVLKKALIMAAAAIAMVAVGVGGAKLKVKAAEYVSGIVNIGYPSDPSDPLPQQGYYFHEDVTVQFDYGQDFTFKFCDSTGTVLTPPATYQFAIGAGSTPAERQHALPNNPDGSWWVLHGWDAGLKEIYFWQATEYTVTYKNYDDSVLQSTSEYYGRSTPAYGPTPTKPADAQYTYTFSSWSPSIAGTVTEDKTYTATYNSTVNNYTITWKNDDGSTLRTDTVAYGVLPDYGGTPSKPDDGTYTYTFSMWNPTVQIVTGDATYTAVYLADPIPPIGGGSSDEDSSSSSGDGSNSGDSSNSGGGSNTTGTDGSTTGNRAPKTADTMPGIMVIALAGLLGGALLITGSRKSSNR